MDRLKQQLCAAVRASLSGKPARHPEAGRELWNAFQRLSATRTYHPAGPNPIQPSEILAWCDLMRLPLAPHHVDIIMAMDRAFLDHVTSRAPAGVKAMAPVSETPLTAGLLDAILG